MGSGQSVLSDETFGEEGQFRVHIKLHAGFSTAERLKLRDACRGWVNVWHSPSFKKWVMEFNFSDTDHTNKEIYDKLLGGLSGANVIDNQADIEIWGRRDPESVGTLVSTTFVHNGEPWEGSERLLTDSVGKVAWQLVYDYCRHQGFLHAGYSEEQSVPFAVAKQTQILIELSEALSGPSLGAPVDVMGMAPEVAQAVAPEAAPQPQHGVKAKAALYESKQNQSKTKPSKAESKGKKEQAMEEPAEEKLPVSTVVPFGGSTAAMESKDQAPAQDAAESKHAVLPVPITASAGDEVKSEEWVEVEDPQDRAEDKVLPEMQPVPDPAAVPKDAYELETRQDEADGRDSRTYAEVVSSKAPAISAKMDPTEEDAENAGPGKENQPRPSLPHQPLSGSKELADFIKNEINFHFDMKEVI